MKLKRFKAEVVSVSDTRTLDNGKRIKNIGIKRVAPTDDMAGDKIGKDDFFEVAVFGNRIDELPESLNGKTVEIGCYLNGRRHTNSKGWEYYKNLVMYSIKILYKVD